MSDTRLYAVTAGGPVPVDPPAGAGDVHEVFDDFPLGVYSGLRTFGGVRFLRLDLHLARTHRCVLLAGWADFEDEPLRRALDEACRAYSAPEAVVRFDVLCEPATAGGVSSRVWLALSPFRPPPAELLCTGVRVELARELHRPRPLIKTTDFVIHRRPYPLNAPEAYEHLMLDEGEHLLEGTSSNFYAVEAGVVRTAGAGVLEGVTRRIVLELAEELGISVSTEALRLGELPRVDEAFLSSSTRALLPIVDVAGTRIGDGQPGPVFRRLRAAFDAYAEREARPAVGLG